MSFLIISRDGIASYWAGELAKGASPEWPMNIHWLDQKYYLHICCSYLYTIISRIITAVVSLTHFCALQIIIIWHLSHNISYIYWAIYLSVMYNVANL